MPIQFGIYRDGQRLTQFQPVGACAIGPESVPITADISVRDGLLTVARPDNHAIGLSLLWDLGPLGAYHMETTRLPARAQPYNLNVELARFRLMKIIQKQEDWNLFDFPKAEKFNARFREGQAMLAEALGSLDPVQAAKIADEALLIGVELSEELAMFHADILLQRRKAANAFVKHIFGSRVSPAVPNQKYRDMLPGNFDYAVVPTPWRMLQPEEHAFNSASLDSWIDAMNKKRVPVIAGPLVNLSEGELPDWLFIWENDFDTLRQMAYEHVQRLVQRYGKRISLWNVCAGVSTNGAFTLTFEQMIEITRLLVAHVKNLLPAARTLITITEPFGEYHARTATSVAPLLYAEMAAQAGINFDGFALNLELGVPRAGHFMRDLFQVSTMLDRFSTMGRPVFITALSVPGRASPDPSDISEGRLNPALGGRWHRPWDPGLQAEWMEAFYRLALSKPFVESIAWGDLADMNQSLPGSGLLDDSFQPKPAFEKLQQLRGTYQRKQS